MSPDGVLGPELLHTLSDLTGISAGLWEQVAAPTRAALTAPGVLSHQALAAPLSEWVSLPEPEALCHALDLLQLSIDLADNVADWSLDQAAGRGLDRAYAGIAWEQLVATPALLVGAAVALLVGAFPDRAGAALPRLVAVLGEMTDGQRYPHGSDGKVERVSGAQGLLLCLPLWLSDDQPSVRAVLPQTEAWARAWARTWELRELATTDSHPDAAERLWHEERALIKTWPEYGPFSGVLSRQRLLSPGVS